MRIRYFPRLLIIVLFLGWGGLSSDEVVQGQAIRWKDIPGANGYIVEVEDNSGKTMEKITISRPEVILKMDPGSYRFRIIALNRFRKVGRVYPWKELIVKPVNAPLVRESPAIYNPGDSKKTFIAKGDYLHRGTKVELVTPSGSKHQADVIVLKDGSGIEVVPPKDLPDGDYSVVYTNTRGKPFRDKVMVDRTLPTIVSMTEKKEKVLDDYVGKDPKRVLEELAEKEREKLILEKEREKEIEQEKIALEKEKESKQDKSISDKDKQTEDDLLTESEKDPLLDETRDYSLTSMMWRQALIPGWGHYHAGHKKTGAFYFLGTLVFAGVAVQSNKIYANRQRDYDYSGESINFSNLISPPDPVTDLYNQSTLQGKYASANAAKLQSQTAVGALGGFYILSLIHVAFTSTLQENSNNAFLLESFPEVWDNQVGTKYRAGIQIKF